MGTFRGIWCEAYAQKKILVDSSEKMESRYNLRHRQDPGNISWAFQVMKLNDVENVLG
jgi:hypothetical protein